MRFVRLLLLCAALLGCMAGIAEAKGRDPELCNMNLFYEDTGYPLSAYQAGEKFKARIAVMWGQCNVSPSYTTIITWWKVNQNADVLPDPRIVEMKEVQVNRIFDSDSQNDHFFLHPIVTIWYGLDSDGKIISSRKEKGEKQVMDLYVRNIFQHWVDVWNSPKDPMTAKVIETMNFASGKWSVPDFKLVIDPEWKEYVRPDIAADYSR